MASSFWDSWCSVPCTRYLAQAASTPGRAVSSTASSSSCKACCASQSTRKRCCGNSVSDSFVFAAFCDFEAPKGQSCTVLHPEWSGTGRFNCQGMRQAAITPDGDFANIPSDFPSDSSILRARQAAITPDGDFANIPSDFPKDSSILRARGNNSNLREVSLRNLTLPAAWTKHGKFSDDFRRRVLPEEGREEFACH